LREITATDIRSWRDALKRKQSLEAALERPGISVTAGN
jgi:hypothetical protein